MSEDYKGQLKRLLRKLFQFDYADLDFGIYRIMNKKRAEIERFIEEDLIDAVDAEFEEYAESRGKSLKEEVESIKSEIREKLGDDAFDESDKIKPLYVTTPFARELVERYEGMRAAMKESDMSDQHEGEIFSHIHQFFSRYYDNGDFMSLRRYSQKEKYAIPYNGEEVVLHWANKDQYYIKTGEHFKNYRFNVGEYSIDFQIKDAESTTNNNKADKRYFVMSQLDENPDYDAGNRTLTMFFEYRGLSEDEEKEYGTRNVQSVIVEKTADSVLPKVTEPGLKEALGKKVNEKTLLEKHLHTYTKRNTTDYFIHKNLKDFLTRELDFYIKNEVFHLDDLGTENETDVAQYVTQAKVIKNISLKIIDFLAQIEDFQKRLFEKKKFVVKTDYCMNLDNVPEELYPEIMRNEEQLNEWKVLFGTGEGKQSTLTSFGDEGVNEKYLKEHPYLAIDTKFFDQEFKDELLASFDDLDEAVGGLMIKSENWQALNLMQEKYKEKVKCIYIDPPYNTSENTFVYKNLYKHSSWITMIDNRIRSCYPLLPNYGTICVAIDDTETNFLKILLNDVFGTENYVSTIGVEVNPAGQNIRPNVPALSHDYFHVYAKQIDNMVMNLRGLKPEEKRLYKEKDAQGYYLWDNLRRRGGNSRPSDRPKQWFPLYADLESKKVSTKPFVGASEIWPIDPKGERRIWRVNIDGAIRFIESGDISVIKKASGFEIVKKTRMPEGKKPKTMWYESKYSATTHGTKLLIDILGNQNFSYPKSLFLVADCLQHWLGEEGAVLDFFAGSGTTAHAVLNLNKEDGGSRKYILVEMGDYFDTVMKPHIQKVMYSDKWKDGKPQSTDGISHIFKYQSLEQYEDTLNNIEFREAGTVQRTLMDMDGYFLRYMLDFETRGSSPCRFNVDKLSKPFDYTLKITEGVELKEETVDVVETFNYLLGIHVKQIKTFSNNGTYYRVVLGRKDEDDIAIIWRDTESIDLVADKEFIEGTVLNGIAPSKTFINSDFFVEGAHPIEPEFKKLMVV